MRGGKEGASPGGDNRRRNAGRGLAEGGGGGRAPLWYDGQKGEGLEKAGTRLGEVGGRIVAETILGILARDKSSYLNVQPSWRPAPGTYRMGHLLLQAGAFVPGEFPNESGGQPG